MTLEDEFKKVSDPYVADIEQIYGDGQKPEKKTKFPKAVFDRVKAFNTEEAFENGWTYYGILKLIMGEIDEEEYWRNPTSTCGIENVQLKPSKEFEQWMNKHFLFGPVLIMLAVIYNNYELED